MDMLDGQPNLQRLGPTFPQLNHQGCLAWVFMERLYAIEIDKDLSHKNYDNTSHELKYKGLVCIKGIRQEFLRGMLGTN